VLPVATARGARAQEDNRRGRRQRRRGNKGNIDIIDFLKPERASSAFRLTNSSSTKSVRSNGVLRHEHARHERLLPHL
jgi:hypothetical protein